MKRIQCYDRNGNSINSLSQYDHDIKIYIYDLEQGIQPRVQFVHSKEIDNTYEAYNNVLSDGIGYRITIPDTFLQKAGQLICFVCYEDDDFVTKYYIAIPINTKPNPTTGFYENDIEFIDYYFLSKEIDEVRDTVEENKRLFDAHITDMGNPHKVTKNQVGLGNVPNVTTNNQEPTYMQASVLENIVSGETLSTSMGKIQKAIDESIKHFADKENPHEVTTEQINAVNKNHLGIANGVATLDNNGMVPAVQLPSYVDDTVECYLSDDDTKAYSDEGMITSIEPETSKIYVNLRNNNTYRWSGSIFVEISKSLALGETENTAYRGDRGKTAYDHSQAEHARVDATLVEKSDTNGNIKIDGEEVNVYIPEDVINSSTQVALDDITASVTAVDEKVDGLAENGLAANIDLIKEALRDVFYPIGTIYESVNATNPSEFIGGTWISWGAGRVSVGVDTSQTEFNTVEKTGGEKSHVLTANELSGHTHSIPTLSGSAVSNGGHTHEVGGVAMDNGAHAHNLDGIAEQNGEHIHHLTFEQDTASGTAKNRVIPASNSGSTSGKTLPDGVHTHTLSGVAVSAGTHGHDVQGFTDKAGAHTHTITTTASTTGSTGSDTAHNNLQPYITSYKWKRTA